MSQRATIAIHASSLLRFLIVGGFATLIHVAIVILSVEWGGIDPPLANMIAFALAFPLSYLGHYHFSFASDAAHRRTISKFISVSVACFLTGQSIMSLFHFLGIAYGIGLVAIVATLPIMSFVLNKVWVFHDRKAILRQDQPLDPLVDSFLKHQESR